MNTKSDIIHPCKNTKDNIDADKAAPNMPGMTTTTLLLGWPKTMNGKRS